MDEAAEVVTLGETMVLFWPDAGAPLERADLFHRTIGGAESNLSIALARLGHHVLWVSRVGDDPFGRYLRATLEREGVQVDAPPDPRAPTGLFFKERVASGPRQVLYYRHGSAASLLDPLQVAALDFTGVRVLHLTGITPALSASCAAAVAAAIRVARAAGTLVSFDPNVRLQLWESEQGCRSELLALIALADLVLLGDEDAAILFPDLDEAAVLDAVRALGPATAVLKLGARGALASTPGCIESVPAYPVVPLDTVGAGDGFDAGFIAGLLRGHDLRRCLQLGAWIGAAAVTSPGDWEGYPTTEPPG